MLNILKRISCLVILLVTSCGGPTADQKAAQLEFFNFVGLHYGDTREDVLKVLGAYLDSPVDLEARKTFKFFNGGVEVKFDVLDRVEIISVNLFDVERNNVSQLIKTEPKLKLTVKSKEEIIQKLGPAGKTMIYDYGDLGPEGNRRAGVLTILCLKIVTDDCVVFLNQWIYID